jgi:peptidoglycan-N-acetylglucosamine deacetylase
MPQHQQIFQTKSSTRKNVFKWTHRCVLYVAILSLPILIIAFNKNSPSLPQLFSKEKKTNYHQEAQEAFFTINEKKKYSGIPQYLGKAKRNPTQQINQKIRAAFYVNWDANSLPTLIKHIDKLNMVLPEWFFIDPIGDTLVSKVDLNALVLMKHFPVKIVPIISNLNALKGDDYWDNNLLKNLLSNPNKRARLISDISSVLEKYQMHGINIDFEEWDNTTSHQVIQFQKDLYNSLHTKGKIVTQDILPIEENDDAIELSKYNDYLFMMAYNQHWSQSEAGDICEQRWIEKVMDQSIQKIPADKLVVCLAGFGYDWKENTEGKVVSYPEALSLALNHKATINFDNDTYNSHYEYTDENDAYHEVYFFDAAAMFNIIRMTDEMGTAGTALWRLGSEDERMWNFYSFDLSNEGLIKVPFNFNQLTDVAYIENTPSYIGNGEVLDVQSSPQSGKFTLEIDSQEHIISEQFYSKLPTQYVIKKWGEVQNQVILTFDDGPDERYTGKILDILEKEKVPASFFITGANAQENLPLLRRISLDGFEIGNHTFSHPNISKVSNIRAEIELKSTRLLIEAITGRSTILFRAPYNADSEPTNVAEIIPIALSKKANYYTIGESIDPRDWEDGTNADSIYNRTIQQYEANPQKGIILLHDAGGNREATVLALPRIIHYFKSHQVEITTIGKILGKTKDEIMPLVNHQFASASGLLAFSIFGFKKFFGYLFGIAFVLGFARIILVLFLAILQKLKAKKESSSLKSNTHQPPVSIIVPAFNEAITIQKTIDNLLKQSYPHFNIIFVDDGSSDNTFGIVNHHYKNNNKVKVFTKSNGGKATALNFGIEKSENEFVVCIDADTILMPNAIAEMMRYFNANNVAAVAGNVKVGNVKNVLTNWQSIEYTIAQNIDRRAFDLINGITIVPGAIGAFRKSAIHKAGGFTTDTLAEDCDLTIRMNQNGAIIRHCNAAIAMTEAPETIKGLLKQRLRWNYGVMQSFWKNRKACFNPKYKGLGLLGLPNILLFQIILPLLSPIADIFFIFSLLWQNTQLHQRSHISVGYLYLLLIDIAFASIAFYFEKESFKKLIYIIPQRILYKPLMYIVIIKSVIRAIKGESQHWGSIHRTGNVKNFGNTMPAIQS